MNKKSVLKVVIMKKIFKRMFCKHEFRTLYNIHGDMINRCDGHRRMNICIKCGKEKLFGGLDPNCKKVNG